MLPDKPTPPARHTRPLPPLPNPKPKNAGTISSNTEMGQFVQSVPKPKPLSLAAHKYPAVSLANIKPLPKNDPSILVLPPLPILPSKGAPHPSRINATPKTSVASRQKPKPQQSDSRLAWILQGDDHLKGKDTAQAIECYTKALQEAERSNDFLNMAFSLRGLGRGFIEKKQWHFAAKILNGAWALFQKAADDIGEQETVDLLTELEKRFLEVECGIKKNVSQSIYMERRRKLQSFRQAVSTQISNDLPSQVILESFSASIIKFVEEVINEGYSLFGKPPCDCTFLALGSLSRKEMSPYSDLEFACLIETNTPQIREYFHKLVKWMELQVICLGETEIKVLAGGNKSPVHRGFSFDDGGNTPIGKQSYFELIKTPQELAQCQSEKFYSEDLILSNVLRSVALITGSKKLYDGYVQSMQALLNFRVKGKQTLREMRAGNLLAGHLVEFEPQMNRQKEERTVFNIKAEMYRLPSFLISALADFFGIEKSSAWDKLDALEERHILCPKGVKNLKDALSAIMRFRICAHLHYKRECDEIYHPSMQIKNPNDQYIKEAFTLSDDDIAKLEQIYRVIFPLHRIFKEFSQTGDLSALHKETFYEDSVKARDAANRHLLRFKNVKDLYYTAVALNPNDIQAIISLVELLRELGEFNEALEHLDKAQAIANESTPANSKQKGEVFKIRATVHLEMRDPQKALEALTIAKNIPGIEESDRLGNVFIMAGIYEGMGGKKKAIQLYEEEVKHFKELVKVYNRGGKRIVLIPEHMGILTNLCSLYSDVGEGKKAVECHMEALKIYQSIFPHHPTLAAVYNNLGLAWVRMGKPKKSFEFYEKALDMYTKIYGENHRDVAMSLNNLSIAYGHSKEYKKAIPYGEKALVFYRRTYGPINQDVADCLVNLGMCYLFQGKMEPGIELLEEALQICLKLSNPDLNFQKGILENLSVAWEETDPQKARAYKEQAQKLRKQLS
ncbi:MAG: tetratricopeptide repeat protein [Parachlamydia sp.]|nr:tetratricopeptide repeat protein [Parachlamydia sp.]